MTLKLYWNDAISSTYNDKTILKKIEANGLKPATWQYSLDISENNKMLASENLTAQMVAFKTICFWMQRFIKSHELVCITKVRGQ